MIDAQIPEYLSCFLFNFLIQSSSQKLVIPKPNYSLYALCSQSQKIGYFCFNSSEMKAPMKYK